MLLNLVGRVALVLLAAAFLSGLGFGMTATNTVPVSHLGLYTVQVTPNAVNPPACPGLGLGNGIISAGPVLGGNPGQGITLPSCPAPLP